MAAYADSGRSSVFSLGNCELPLTAGSGPLAWSGISLRELREIVVQRLDLAVSET